MKHTTNSLARSLTILAAIALAWCVAGSWLDDNPLQRGRASAAALTVQSVSMAPQLDKKVPKGSGGVQGASLDQGFIYQGRLLFNSVPANGQYDLQFSLFDAASGGNQVGNTNALTDQTVTSGLFTVSLDFGPSAFYGDARWLEIAVRSTGGGSFTTLSPRQPLTAVPFSLSTKWEATSNKPFPFNPLRLPNSISTADSASNVGYFTSIAVGSDGLGLISHEDADQHRLRVTHCSDLACTSSTSSNVDSSVYVGNYTSIAIGSDGLGLISYYDYTSQNLKVAHCADVLCTSATLTTIDSTGDVGNGSSVVIGSDGLGLIVYQDYTNRALKVAHCSNATCSAATLATLDPTVGNVYYTSLTLGSDGLALVAYSSGASSHLKVAHCSNVACDSATISTYDSPYYAYYPSIAIGSDGLGLISYYGSGDGYQRLKIAHCSNVTCTAATLAILDPSTQINYQTSIAIGPDGLGLISYMDYANADLKVAHCSNATCSTATATTVDSTGWVGEQSAIAIGSDGLGLISYRDGTNTHLKVAHCGSPLCLPYQHNR